MKNLVLLLLFVISTSCLAQTASGQTNKDTIAVNTTYKDGSKNEIYSVNKEGNKIGKYTRYTRYGKVFIDGQYNNGSPVGIWNYYSSDTAGALVETLNFDLHKETFLDSANVNFLLCGPRYFGGNTAKQEYIQLHIKTDFTEQEKAMMKGKSVLAVFEVDPRTFTTYGISVENIALPKDITDKIIKIIADMPAWLSPVCDKGDQPVWRQSVVFVF